MKRFEIEVVIFLFSIILTVKANSSNFQFKTIEKNEFHLLESFTMHRWDRLNKIVSKITTSDKINFRSSPTICAAKCSKNKDCYAFKIENMDCLIGKLVINENATFTGSVNPKEFDGIDG